MMVQHSAGILFYRRAGSSVEVLLAHPGGPYWRNKDMGAWQIPKGVIWPDEDAATAARREAMEELGVAVEGDMQPLVQIRQAGGKIVEVFAREQSIDPAKIISNRFKLEWPPRSGMFQSFPEIDSARWIPLAEADDAILASQRPLLAALRILLAKAG